MAGTNVQVFEFEESDSIRCGQMADGEPYLIATDVCKVAGHTNVSQALARLDDDEKGIISSDTLGGEQALLYVTEAGFYTLLLTFRLRKGSPNYDKLKRFRRWVTHEVLPALRKTGSYSLPGAVAPPATIISPTADTSTTDLLAMAEVLVGNLRRQVDMERSLRAVHAQLELTRGVAEQSAEDAARAVRTVTQEAGYYTLVTWAEQHGIRLVPPHDSIEGKVVAGMCRAKGLETGTWNGPRYAVKTYPEDVLRLWLDAYRGREDPKRAG